MKNQYFGDINDYVKYGLLRRLCAGSGLRLGVAFWRTPDDGRGDGSVRQYVDAPERWARHDPTLFALMQQAQAARDVRNAEAWGVLPGAVFHHAVLAAAPAARAAYVRGARAALAHTDLVFMDPDNGLEVPSVKVHGRGGEKYVAWEEVEAFHRAGHSVIVYQHFPREERAQYVARRLQVLRERTGAAWVGAAWTGRVAYLVAAQEAHVAALGRGLRDARAHWSEHLAFSDVPGAAPAWS
ncbi:MAG: hypothetical protein RL653_973 [Pseudomonadota bacterium]|jgi:hypothetical protein